MSFSGLRLTRPADEADSADLKRVKRLLEILAATVPLEAPWAAEHARRVGRRDCRRLAGQEHARRRDEAGLRDQPLDRTGVALAASRCFTTSFTSARPAASAHSKPMRRNDGSWVARNPSRKGWQGRWPTELVLGSPVSRIVDEDKAGVEVESKRLKVLARRVVVAMMPADTRRIAFTPGLPPARRGLVEAWRGEPAIKVNVVYDRAILAEGRPQRPGSDRPAADRRDVRQLPTRRIARRSARIPDRGQRGQRTRRRRTAVLAGLAELFGRRARSPVAYFEPDWSRDGWTSGCVSPLPRNVLTRFGPALRAPVGRIHWAGTETSEVWCGYMDGAVRSGERVAAEVLASLRSGQM